MCYIIYKRLSNKMLTISLILSGILVIVIFVIMFKKKICESFSISTNSTNPTNPINLTNLTEANDLNKKISILVFVSETCSHCVNYNKTTHFNLVQWANTNGYELKRIFAHDDKDKLFEKYNIEYVPACIIIKGSKTKLLDGTINENNIENAIKTI